MFFILSKMLNVFISPIVWVIIIQLVMAFINNAGLRRKLMLINLSLLLVFTNGHLSGFMVQKWEHAIVPKENLEKVFDYGIVLGGISDYYQESKRLQFNKSADRLIQALDLYHSGKIEKLIVAGGSGKLVGEDERESVHIRQFLVDNGLPEEDVLIESRSRNTYENAKFVAEQFGTDTATFLLVTSAFHMKRAYACFAKQGLQVKPYPVDYIVKPEKEKGDFFRGWMPSAGPMMGWNLLAKEWIGFLAYKMKGYL
jgi:uncharacterized SAM-binding protein YcdF (DUF218 family)